MFSSQMRGLCRMTAACAAALIFAGCSEPSGRVPEQGGGPRLVKKAPPGQATGEKRMAISHDFALRLPSNEIEPVQQRHLEECRKLDCTILSTRLDRAIEGRIKASLSLRITPEAFAAFSGVITAPPAELVSHSETAEDKTLPMLDVEKRLEVKLALRDRLSAMLKEPGNKSAADLALIEKELAQVQGDIESAQAQRDYLRTITETYEVEITYLGRPAMVMGFDLLPINRAIAGMAQTLVASIAALITFAVAVVPWLPLLAGLWWGVRRYLRGRKAGMATG